MNVYVMTDLEGVAGVVTFYSQTSPGGTYYERARKLLTEEINAAVDGLLSAGADDILVCDGHGPGGVVYEDLHPAAMLMHGRPLAPRQIRDDIIQRYDVAIMVGQHAMAGNLRANMNHTQNSHTIDRYTLNGKPIGEIAQFALYMGALGLPVIFLSGDREACREAEDLVPGITTAQVKESLSRNSAVSLSRDKANQCIREGAKTALETQARTPLESLVWPAPFVLEKRFFHTDSADAAMADPRAERVDGQTVRLRSSDIRTLIYS